MFSLYQALRRLIDDMHPPYPVAPHIAECDRRFVPNVLQDAAVSSDWQNRRFNLLAHSASGMSIARRCIINRTDKYANPQSTRSHAR
jgi:hypothetical protein